MTVPFPAAAINAEPTLDEWPRKADALALLRQRGVELGKFDTTVLGWTYIWKESIWLTVLSWIGRAEAELQHRDVPIGPIDREPTRDPLAPAKLIAVLEQAIPDLGSYDREVADWIASVWRPGYLMTVLSIVRRAGRARDQHPERLKDAA